jgi:hypothetical protein
MYGILEIYSELEGVNEAAEVREVLLFKLRSRIVHFPQPFCFLF